MSNKTVHMGSAVLSKVAWVLAWQQILFLAPCIANAIYITPAGNRQSTSAEIANQTNGNRQSINRVWEANPIVEAVHVEVVVETIVPIDESINSVLGPVLR